MLLDVFSYVLFAILYHYGATFAYYLISLLSLDLGLDLLRLSLRLTGMTASGLANYGVAYLAKISLGGGIS